MRGPERGGMADDVGAVFSSHSGALVKRFDAHAVYAAVGAAEAL
jgi:hypothetical protein